MKKSRADFAKALIRCLNRLARDDYFGERDIDAGWHYAAQMSPPRADVSIRPDNAFSIDFARPRIFAPTRQYAYRQRAGTLFPRLLKAAPSGDEQKSRELDAGVGQLADRGYRIYISHFHASPSTPHCC